MAETKDGFRVSGIVLAAGGSRRMGAPKQLLVLRGRPLVVHVVEAALASALDEVVVVLGRDADAVRAALAQHRDPRLRLVVNPRWEQGQSESLRCGLAAADPDASAAAVILADQPGLTAALVDRVLAAFRASTAAAARPVYPEAGGAPGHPVVLSRHLFGELRALRGDTGARALLEAHPEWLLSVPLPGKPPGDIDTPEDHRRAARDDTPRA
jgi:molybdenum cofactor cytidylyltransferase